MQAGKNEDQSHAGYMQGMTFLDLLKENLIAERIAIDSYPGMIEYLADQNPTARAVLAAGHAVGEKRAGKVAGLQDNWCV